MREFSNFYKIVRFFKKNISFEKSIVVRRKKIRKHYDGLCTIKNDKFHIYIDKNLSENYAIDVFLHEIAHALSWNQELDEHGDSWGKAYSIVYRKFLEIEK